MLKEPLEVMNNALCLGMCFRLVRPRDKGALELEQVDMFLDVGEEERGR